MPETNNNLVLGGLLTCAVGMVGVGLYLMYQRRGGKFRQVGVVSRLFIHPIKSCRGLEISQADCIALGIKFDGIMDRSFMIIDSQESFVTGRSYPAVACIVPSLSEDKRSLLVDAPDMPILTVPLIAADGEVVDTKVFRDAVKGEDCGKEAADWLSQYLGKPGFRLVRYNDRLPNSRHTKNDPSFGMYAKDQEKIVYQDQGQVHALGLASLEDLNSRLEKTVQINNFRPNIVFEGSAAYSEDGWKYVRIGDDVIMRKTHQCGRCLQTTVDPATGKFSENGDPLKTLKEFRKASADHPDKEGHGQSPLFGVLLAVEQQGSIKIGDVIYTT